MRKEYYTKQTAILINFFKNNPDKQYSVSEIINEICNNNLGKSTVYRLLPKLMEKGEIKQYVKQGSKQFVYQLNNCNTCANHLHLKCLSCGKILHLGNSLSSEFEKSVLQNNNFAINEELTMLYGNCFECLKTKEVKE